MRFYRQVPPCILNNGTGHVGLLWEKSVYEVWFELRQSLAVRNIPPEFDLTAIEELIENCAYKNQSFFISSWLVFQTQRRAGLDIP